jgi:oxygen-independent coproporphyrinogen-3 oxidase
MLNALRLPGGFTRALFETRTGLDASAVAAPLRAGIDAGLLCATAGGWQPTGRGLLFLNDLQALFLAEAA